MLILKDVSRETEGEWFNVKVRGETIRLKIRPLTSEIYNDVRKKHKRTVREVNPLNRKMEKVEKYDDEAVGEELIDYIIEDFEGVGTAPGEPLEVTVENKIRLLEIPTMDDEVDISSFAFEKAREMAAVSEKDFKELEKN